MNPMLMMALSQMMQGGQGAAPTGHAVQPMPGTSGGMPGTQDPAASDAAAAMFGSVQGGEPFMPPQAYAMAPASPSAMNPGFTAALLQLLQSTVQPPQQQQSLGQILRG